ncbi:hypothetical protein ACFL6M_07100 [Candidatus Eisenbacteria bacterium]|uniref:Uncharacterized protein n=1 Tax=Eiseniibacteriota bacterium TaxID=2212470 RepID=A0ABV6YME0_UNCEI
MKSLIRLMAIVALVAAVLVPGTAGGRSDTGRRDVEQSRPVTKVHVHVSATQDHWDVTVTVRQKTKAAIITDGFAGERGSTSRPTTGKCPAKPILAKQNRTESQPSALDTARYKIVLLRALAKVAENLLERTFREGIQVPGIN